MWPSFFVDHTIFFLYAALNIPAFYFILFHFLFFSEKGTKKNIGEFILFLFCVEKDQLGRCNGLYYWVVTQVHNNRNDYIKIRTMDLSDRLKIKDHTKMNSIKSTEKNGHLFKIKLFVLTMSLIMLSFWVGFFLFFFYHFNSLNENRLLYFVTKKIEILPNWYNQCSNSQYI